MSPPLFADHFTPWHIPVKDPSFTGAVRRTQQPHLERRGIRYWEQPVYWSHDHEEAVRSANLAGVHPPQRPRIYCNPCPDWLHPEVPDDWLFDLIVLIHKTPNLVWFLESATPHLFKERLLAAASQCTIDPLDITDRIYAWIEGSRTWNNLWVGTKIVNQEQANQRIGALMNIPGHRFLQVSPPLGPIDLCQSGAFWSDMNNVQIDGRGLSQHIHCVFCCGESGQNSKPMHPDWVRSIRDQCDRADVAFIFDGWGDWVEATFGNIDRSKSVLCIESDGTDSTNWSIDRLTKRTAMMALIGSDSSGCLLDGREHRQFPSCCS